MSESETQRQSESEREKERERETKQKREKERDTVTDRARERREGGRESPPCLPHYSYLHWSSRQTVVQTKTWSILQDKL